MKHSFLWILLGLLSVVPSLAPAQSASDHIYTLSSHGWLRNSAPSWKGSQSEVLTCSVCKAQVQVQIDVGPKLSPGAPFTTDEQFLASVKTPAQQKQFADGLLKSKGPSPVKSAIRLVNTDLTKVGGQGALEFAAIIESPQMPAIRETNMLLLYRSRIVKITLSYFDGSFSPKDRKAVDTLLSSLTFL